MLVVISTLEVIKKGLENYTEKKNPGLFDIRNSVPQGHGLASVLLQHNEDIKSECKKKRRKTTTTTTTMIMMMIVIIIGPQFNARKVYVPAPALFQILSKFTKHNLQHR